MQSTAEQSKLNPFKLTQNELSHTLKKAGLSLMPEYNREEILANPLLAPGLEALRTEAEHAKSAPLCELPFHAYRDFDTNGIRLSYENLYFGRRRCLGILTLAAWLYGDKDCLALAEDYLWAICGEFTWALPAHLNGNSLNESVNPLTLDLFSTETGQTLAEICALLKNQLHPAVQLRCRSEISRRILTPFLTRTSPCWWESCEINWAAVCAGSIGMAGIYCIEDPDRLAELLVQLLPVLKNFLRGFKMDGACLEGLSYWTYGMSYFTVFADLLLHRSAGAIDLLSCDKVREIAAFQGKCYFDGGHTVSFSDASCTDTYRVGITDYLSRYFHFELPTPPASSAAPFGTDPCARWCQMLRDFVWAEKERCRPAPDPGAFATKAAPASCILPDAQWLIFHGSDGCGGAIKGGHNDEPHNHNDIGSFFFLLHGREVLADLGAGEYTKDSFNDMRYTIFTNNSFSHSVPVIDGHGQKTGREYAARDCRFEDCLPSFCKEAASGARASMDIAPAYGDNRLLSLVRNLTFDDSAHSLILCDQYRLSDPSCTVEERFVTRQMPVIRDTKENAGSVTLFSEAQEPCTLFYDASLLTASVSTDVHRRHEDGAEEVIYLLRFVLNRAAAEPVLRFTLKWQEEDLDKN